jgi:hypothetical protein
MEEQYGSRECRVETGRRSIHGICSITINDRASARSHWSETEKPSAGLAELTRDLQRHTDLIEPLSLDEAYPDLAENKTGIPTATPMRYEVEKDLRLS